MEYFQNQAAQQLYLECIKELEPKATECFENEHEIERELKLLEREIAEHHKIVKKWLGLVKQLNQSEMSRITVR
ncbi:hypothetical protein EDD86DRAFT_244589 [Gorgonomyces haynaldii]|nr:hypothetical protein EDD86DRAFT_244589 [Gorgonomyces haynaldii]